MGTRSITVFEEDGLEICALYRQYDGYPEGHGNELKEFLCDVPIVNGFSPGATKQANGMGCLAAQVIAHFKTEVGNFYVQRPGVRDCGEEFVYTIYTPSAPKYPRHESVHLKVQGGCVTYFGLPGTKQENMPVLYDGPISQFDAEKATQAYRRLAQEIPNDYLESKEAL